MAKIHGWDLREALRLTLVASRREAEPRTLFELAEAAFKGGVTALQLREKTASDLEAYELAKSLAPFCRERGKLFLVDDRLDVALAAGADGVHLGQADLPAEAACAILPRSKILGVSASNLAQAEKALAAGADYLGLGAIIPTDSKTDASVISQADIKAVNSLGAITVAIGGITLSNASAIWAMGFQGLAVISALTKAPDPEAAARRLLEGAKESSA